jgi:hypothetical protein
MRTSNRVVLVVAAAVAIAGPALAGGQGSTPSSTPAGFSHSGGHNGFETYTSSTTTTEKLPGGWDEGKGAWKAPLQSFNPVLTTSPVGHGHR